MEILIAVVGTFFCLVICVGMIALMLLCIGKAYERFTEGVMRAAVEQERMRTLHHYHATSWWFSEFPDVQHALALVAEEIATGRCDSSRLRDDWKRKTGRKP